MARLRTERELESRFGHETYSMKVKMQVEEGLALSPCRVYRFLPVRMPE